MRLLKLIFRSKLDQRTKFLQLLFISRYYAEITMIIGMFIFLILLVKKYL